MAGKHKRRNAAWMAASQYGGNGYGPGGGLYGGTGFPRDAAAAYAPGYGPQPGFGAAGLNAGLLQSMPAFLRTGGAGSFLLGAAVGATAAWVLCDEELRGRIARSAMRLYSGIAGGVEEMKEQVADLRAEVDAERGTGA